MPETKIVLTICTNKTKKNPKVIGTLHKLVYKKLFLEFSYVLHFLYTYAIHFKRIALKRMGLKYIRKICLGTLRRGVRTAKIRKTKKGNKNGLVFDYL
jgi:hypothetical protein